MKWLARCLLTLTHQAQADKAKVSLENGYVDLGAYRYVLANRSNGYRLYNPLKDAKDRNQSIATAKAELDHAIAEADKQKQEISRLNAEAEKERQAEKMLNKPLQTHNLSLAKQIAN